MPLSVHLKESNQRVGSVLNDTSPRANQMRGFIYGQSSALDLFRFFLKASHGGFVRGFVYQVHFINVEETF